MATSVFRPALFLGAGAFLLAASAVADYDSHPELWPERRCGMIRPSIGGPPDPGGAASLHCQPLFWDLPAAARVGFTAAAAPIPDVRAPWYPNGATDRPPPLYVSDRDGNGVSDDGQGYETPGPGRSRLCPDPDEIPWWKPVLDAQGQPAVGGDPTFGQKGPLFTVACRRGTRVRFGPWQFGRERERQDDITEGVVRFENSARLDRDVVKRGLDVAKHGRLEWHTGTEFYSHIATHHVVCWSPENSRCNNPRDPWAASDMARCRAGYQEVADGPEAPGGKGVCYAGDADTRCLKPEETGESVRAYAMFPGRVYFGFAPNEAEMTLENQLWDCYQHLVPELPPKVAYHVTPESFGLTGHADFRKQAGGLANTSGGPQGGADPGQVIGGAVGEVVIQYFTEAFTTSGYGPASAPVSARKGDLGDLLHRTHGRQPWEPAGESSGGSGR